MEKTALDVREYNQLTQAEENMNMVVTKDYLGQLSKYDILEIDPQLRNIDICSHTRLYKLNKLVYQRDESMVDKLSTALHTAFTVGASVIMILDSDGENTNFYFGVVDKNRENGSTAGEAFSGALRGNFQGSDLENQNRTHIEEIIEKIVHPENQVVSSISAIPSLRKKDKDEIRTYTQGIENMVDALAGSSYTAVIIADPVSPLELSRIETGYEELYSQLSMFSKTDYNFNESDSLAFTHTTGETITDAVNKSTALSNNTSTSTGWNTSESDSKSNNTTKQILTAVGGAIGMIPNIVPNIVGGIMTLGASFIPEKSHSTSYGTSGGTSTSKGTSTTEGTSKSTGKSTSDSESETNQHGRSLQISKENKSVQNMMEKINEHIKRVKNCRVFGAFNCSAYVLSNNTETNSMVCANYNALMRGESSSMQASYVNTWKEEDETAALREYLGKLSHPVFARPEDENVTLPLSAASIISGQELAVQVGLPKRSINGVSVVESAAFGRNIYKLSDNRNERKIEIGHFYHMGKTEENRLSLDLDSLTSHVFITGSTGSGKSNTIYELLDKAERSGVKFMVIEPAKGEYKAVFGGRDDVQVYGTNPGKSDLIRINPFRFAKGIHILEHLDRLVEIFNVCWPMYAAMPAVLKKAVERAYEACGWNLMTSVNEIDENLFPTFQDVTDQVYAVINESAYSQDNKSDYIGSLATRLESLTTGFYRLIFSNDDISDEELFQKNVIVDLSRIGSIETKSLLMGMLVMKLQEYYMADDREPNSQLQHITVLEEAHNLLKRTSTEQSSESSNLLGKSVEMLTNAIAEMRTYGEGFVIADQSPGLLDMAVIRNTNTKIVLRLPDFSDRELVGKSMGLNEQQIIELSKLPKGVAAISQNDWLEAVLCKVNHFQDEKPYHFENAQTQPSPDIREEVVKFLLADELGQPYQEDVDQLRAKVLRSNLPVHVKGELAQQMQQKDDVFVDKVIYDIFYDISVFDKAASKPDYDEWNDYICRHMQLETLDMQQRQIVLNHLLREITRKDPKYLEVYNGWKECILGSVQ